MQKNIAVRRTLASFGTVAAIAAGATAASAVDVTVNGQAAVFNPPPVMKAGRVFVPLRGVFERLGASVVYQGGVINATGNGRQISIKIGSTAATVDGQAKTLDSPAFIVGASTYVPLRFVGEALGAGVNFDAAHQIVALTTAAGVAGGSQAVAPAALPASNAVSTTDFLTHHQPARGSTVSSTRPTVSADFTSPVDPQSVHVMLDGRDVTAASTISSTGFVYAPPSPLQSIPHTVQVDGKVTHGAPFTNEFKFTTGTQAPTNSITLTSPAEAATVPSSFTISGKTLPNAAVHIVAGATATLGGAFSFGTGSYNGDTVADANGNFSQQVTLQTVSGSAIGLTVTSTDPVTKDAAEKKLRLRAQ